MNFAIPEKWSFQVLFHCPCRSCAYQSGDEILLLDLVRFLARNSYMDFVPVVVLTAETFFFCLISMLLVLGVIVIDNFLPNWYTAFAWGDRGVVVVLISSLILLIRSRFWRFKANWTLCIFFFRLSTRCGYRYFFYIASDGLCYLNCFDPILGPLSVHMMFFYLFWAEEDVIGIKVSIFFLVNHQEPYAAYILCLLIMEHLFVTY